MKHIVITRCNFSDNLLFEKYLGVIQKYFIPGLNNQTNKNFILGLVANEHHFNIIRELVTSDIKMVRFTNQKVDYKDYVIKNNITIQTRHDCDDYMCETYIDRIQNEYYMNKKKYNDFIVTFQPIKIDYINNTEYKHNRDYSKVCSMFSTLVEIPVKNGIMDVMHDHLTRITKNVIYIPETYVKLVIHNNNTLSKINQNDVIINGK